MGWSGAMTRRQFLVWNVWLALDMDRPSRTDAYIMQLTCEVRRILADKPNQVDPNQFKIRFESSTPLGQHSPLGPASHSSDSSGNRGEPEAPVDPLKVKSATMAAQARWFSRVGGRVQIIDPGGPGPTPNPSQ